MSNLAFYSADTMGTTLYQIAGQLKGTETREIRLGPWMIDVPVTVESDIIGQKEISYWMHLAKMLTYVIVRDKECWLLVLDADIVQWMRVLVVFQQNTSVRERLGELRPAIVATFEWTDEGWHQVEMA